MGLLQTVLWDLAPYRDRGLPFLDQASLLTLLLIKYKEGPTYRIPCIAHGILLNVICQPGWGQGLGEN